MGVFSKACEYVTHNSEKERMRLSALNIESAESDDLVVLFVGDYHRFLKKTKKEMYVPFAIAQNQDSFDNMRISWHMDEFKVPLNGKFYEFGQCRANVVNGRISKEGMISFDVLYHDSIPERFSYSCSSVNKDTRKDGEPVIFEGQWDVIGSEDIHDFDPVGIFTMKRYLNS